VTVDHNEEVLADIQLFADIIGHPERLPEAGISYDTMHMLLTIAAVKDEYFAFRLKQMEDFRRAMGPEDAVKITVALNEARIGLTGQRGVEEIEDFLKGL
jgi:hypothetical protein